MTDFRFQLFSDLLKLHEDFKERSITHRRFKHQQIIELLDKYSEKYKVEEIGKSVEGRLIKMISIGKGKTNILLWSQMHGDEPTSTMALMDIISLLDNDNEGFINVKNLIERELTIHLIPVLNPDGAEAYTRRNAIGIDLNRDAKTLTSPEAKAFNNVIDKIKPHFAFNLHDQNPRYTVGDTTEVAAISFLAPPFDYHRSNNTVRNNAMKVIVGLNQLMQKFLPGKVGRFSDEYESRAFGDNIQKLGTSTILLESGGFINDPEKQELRKLNFALLISAFYSIANKDYQNADLKEYEAIPFNTRNVYDFIIRNAIIKSSEKEYKVDLGINRYETPIKDGFYFKSKLEEFGDLSSFKGIIELEASGMEVLSGKCFVKKIDPNYLNIEEVFEYLKQGYTYLISNTPFDEEGPAIFPINFANRFIKQSRISIDTNANLLLTKDNVVKIAIVNGFPIDLSQDQKDLNRGIFVL